MTDAATPPAKSLANRNNPWYFILPNGSVFEWDGKAGLNGTQVAAITPDSNLWQDPSLLTDAFVAPSVNSAGFDEARHFFIDRSEKLATTVGRLRQPEGRR